MGGAAAVEVEAVAGVVVLVEVVPDVAAGVVPVAVAVGAMFADEREVRAMVGGGKGM